jgi:3-oxoacyl-[acyl-carrier protein] reductase
MTFENQVALVTGGGEGIGHEIAFQYAARGGMVILNDIRPDRLERAAASIRELGPCIAHPGDAADVDVARALVDRALAEFGRVDAIIANAGLTLWCDFFECEPEAFERVVSLNLRGSFFLAQAGARAMRRRGGGGRILLMSSVLGERGVSAGSVYAMTKAALRMMARSIAIEVAPFGITVNAIAPGAIATRRTLAEEPDYEETWRRLAPLGRAGTPLDIAEAAMFLLSPAAAYITGQTLTVDGGWTAGEKKVEG